MSFGSREGKTQAGRPGWLRPAVHFLVLGSLLFALRSLLPALGGWPGGADVVIEEAEIQRLAEEHSRRWGRPPTREELQGLVQQSADDQILEQEAQRLGLADGDLTIRQRLIGKMRAVSADPTADDEALYRGALELGFDRDVVVSRLLRQKLRLLLQRDLAAAPPTEVELQEWFGRHGDRFEIPPRIDFTQVFVSPSLHGEAATERARTVAERLRRENLSSDAAAALSDPFPLAAQWRGRSREEIAERFGEDFATQVMGLELEAWSPPLPSRYGLHLVRAESRHRSRQPSLESVRERVVRGYEEARAAARLDAALADLRERYRVRVNWPSESPTGEQAGP